MKKNGLKIYSVIISVLALLLIAALVVILLRFTGNNNIKTVSETENTTAITTEYAESTTEHAETTTEEESVTSEENQYNAGNIVAAANGEEEGFEADDVIKAWKTMISQLDFDSDVVFLGDSLTQRSNFKQYFPDKKIVNLGLGGDKIQGVQRRCDSLSCLNPEKIFVMCGVNELRDDNADTCISEYDELLEEIRKAVPSAQIYVESILPMTVGMQDYLPCHAQTTEYFNSLLKMLAEEKNMVYVDLYDSFVLNGEMNEELTEDGVHLNSAGYDIWAQKINDYIYN